MRTAKLVLAIFAMVALAGAPEALAGAPEALASTGGASTGGASTVAGFSGGAGVSASTRAAARSRPTVAGWKAKIVHGVAYAPSKAPLAVQDAIWAGDQIHTKPYLALHYPSLATVWPAYDCSGSVSYVLYRAGLLGQAPDVSGDFETYGARGPGRWITVWGSAGHAFIEVAGIVFDTSHYAPTTPGGTGPRWQPASIIAAQLQDGNIYSERHPVGF